jgi:hypothetical protein
MGAPFLNRLAKFVLPSLLTYAETVECLDGGSCLIEDLLDGLLRILSESLLNQGNFLDEAGDATFDDL